MLEFFSFQNKGANPQNLKKQPVPEKKKDQSKDITKWQTSESNKNNFPQQLIQNVYNSPAGSAAIDVWHEFVEGDGLADSESAGKEINKKQSLNDLHGLLSADIAFLWGFCYIQKYNLKGEKTEIFHLPFEETRLGIPDENGEIDKIYHNPYYGTNDFKEEYTKWFYAYNDDPNFVQGQIKQHNIDHADKKTGEIDPPYPGQVYWFSIEKPLARVYPQPFYYSAIKWFQVDYEIQNFHERNLKNNLLLSVLINMHGDPSAPAGPAEQKKLSEDPDATLDQSETVGGQMNEQMKTFQNEKGGVLINWFKKDEEKATFEAFPTNSHHDLFTVLQNVTSDQIAIGTKVPRVLLGIGEAGKLADTQEILNAVRVMQGRTRRMRAILQRTYEEVVGVENGAIKNINPVNVIPDTVWNSLTPEEQRTWIEGNFDIELIETGTEGTEITIENAS